MFQLGCRPRNLSLICVVVLGLSNLLLTFLLLQGEPCNHTSTKLAESQKHQQPQHDQPEVTDAVIEPCPTLATFNDQKPENLQHQLLNSEPTEESSSLELDIRLGRWDSRRLYRMFDAALVGSRFVELSESSKVCLATQSSLEKLGTLVQVVHQWTGPISVALFAAGDEEFEALQRYLEYLRRCYASVRERVLFSMAIPKSRPPKQQPRYYPLDDFLDCRKPEASLLKIMGSISSEQNSWRIRNVYPQNHMRNLARNNCHSEYVFLTDVDIVPSSNMSKVLDEFLASAEPRACDKCAYVIPTFELDARVRFPQNKSDLVRLSKKGLARPFHQKVFIHNQFATDFTRWMQDATPLVQASSDKEHQQQNHASSTKSVGAYVSHDVTNFEFLYEPFYVARDHVPPHDERFMGYGYTRNTQVGHKD
ncbi:hypothetical protein QAD02_009528 [Eretmocerus hayati]|uniref:Uncharacterized protein n=1 Tax=Eretmocerus hayati TaxID=131215 RepID=A0ACC2N9N4_9HYME|nr:hypothetical protein QAD02_009528 [Eretmocerus hayati]